MGIYTGYGYWTGSYVILFFMLCDKITLSEMSIIINKMSKSLKKPTKTPTLNLYYISTGQVQTGWLKRVVDVLYGPSTNKYGHLQPNNKMWNTVVASICAQCTSVRNTKIEREWAKSYSVIGRCYVVNASYTFFQIFFDLERYKLSANTFVKSFGEKINIYETIQNLLIYACVKSLEVVTNGVQIYL